GDARSKLDGVAATCVGGAAPGLVVREGAVRDRGCALGSVFQRARFAGADFACTGGGGGVVGTADGLVVRERTYAHNHDATAPEAAARAGTNVGGSPGALGPAVAVAANRLIVIEHAVRHDQGAAVIDGAAADGPHKRAAGSEGAPVAADDLVGREGA